MTDQTEVTEIHFLPDPLGKHPELTREEVAYLMGMIPSWVAAHARLKDAPQLLAPFMLECYGHGGFPMGGTVTLSGVYKYPEDPDLYPIAQLTCGQKTVLVYQYGMATIIENNNKPPLGDNAVTYRFGLIN